MRVFDERYSIAGVVVQMKREARSGRFTGDKSQRSKDYIDRCSAFHTPSATHAVFDREEGVHQTVAGERALGRCYTLVLTFLDTAGNLTNFDPIRAHAWITAFFGADADKVWIEKSPAALHPRAAHLFTDEKWNPIHMPTAEMERKLLERGWKPYEFGSVLQESACIAGNG